MSSHEKALYEHGLFDLVPAAEALKKEEAAARKNVEDLAELILEKVEFLKEGKEAVSPVQVMAIQIEV